MIDSVRRTQDIRCSNGAVTSKHFVRKCRPYRRNAECIEVVRPRSVPQGRNKKPQYKGCKQQVAQTIWSGAVSGLLLADQTFTEADFRDMFPHSDQAYLAWFEGTPEAHELSL